MTAYTWARDTDGCEELCVLPNGMRARHFKACEWLSRCDACAKLYNDAVVRQRVERMTTRDVANLRDYRPGVQYAATIKEPWKADLLAALTGENA